jgi:arginyl-tRNA synthetase
MLSFSGHTVKRINHVGDWGTPFGMILALIDDMKLETAENISISKVTKLYQEAKIKDKTDPVFNKKAREMVIKLQSGDEWATKRLKELFETSDKMFNEIYTRLNIDFPDGTCGESFYNDKIENVINLINEKGLITNDDNGAKLIFTPEFKEPLILVKSDGSICYDSTDIAAVHHRLVTLKMDKVLYVTDPAQSLHFKMLFNLADKMGWSDEINTKCVNNSRDLKHIKFGVVLSPDGKPIKSRDGSSVKLIELLDEAKNRVSKELIKRSETNKTYIEPEKIQEISAHLGYAAVKYADLRNQRETNYKFDFDQMLNFNGDTAIYILYSYARICSVIRKCFNETGISIEDCKKTKVSLVGSRNEPEWKLALMVNRFDEFFRKSLDKLEPHILCDYLYKLATLVSKFWDKYRLLNLVSKESKKHKLDSKFGKSRLIILEATRITMKTVLDILNIKALEKI